MSDNDHRTCGECGGNDGGEFHVSFVVCCGQDVHEACYEEHNAVHHEEGA